MVRILHLTTHINAGGITVYILRLGRPLLKHDIHTSVLSSGGAYAGMFREHEIPDFNLPIRTKSELHPKLWLALPELIRLIRREKIDLLHAHTRITQVLAFFAGRVTRVPVVTTCHGFYKRRLGRRILPAWGDRVIAISEPVADHLEKDWHVSGGRIRIVNNAVDIHTIDESFKRLSPQDAKARFGFKAADPVVGIVARLAQDKGHSYLLQAASGLVGKFPRLKILIVGDGRERENLTRMAEELGISQSVAFTGTLDDVAPALAAMDIFAFPATWREGFGLSIIEAMTCAKPVIVTNIWALNSLIEDGKTGILIEPKRADLLAVAIEQLLSDENLRIRIGRNSRVKVEESFGIERMAREIAAVYDEVLTSAKS